MVDSWSLATPTLNKDTLWPKEKKLLEILTQEKAQGRQCWVFCVYTSTHPVLERLETIIQAGRIHGEGARCRQGSHQEPQRMDCQECPRGGRDHLPSPAGTDRTDAV